MDIVRNIINDGFAIDLLTWNTIGMENGPTNILGMNNKFSA